MIVPEACAFFQNYVATTSSGMEFNMEKVNAREVQKALKQANLGNDDEILDYKPYAGVHHFHDWDHGYDAIYGYNGTRREFYADLRCMMSFFLDYIDYCCISKFIITPYKNRNQITYYDDKNDIYREIHDFLKSRGIRRGSQCGINFSIKGNENIIEMLIEGAFRGVSELDFFSQERSIYIVPNHHFDLVFFTNNFNQEKAVIQKLIKNYNKNLVYFEREIS